MAKPAFDLTADLARLEQLTLFDLRGEWRRLYRRPPPKRLSRDLLLRGMAYHLQERAFGGHSKSVLRKLEHAGSAKADKPTVNAAPTPKPGTRLIREWHGVTHTVLVHADGAEWRGQRYRSLTTVARAITGAHWSGPRFFGLRSRRANPDRQPEASHAQT